MAIKFQPKDSTPAKPAAKPKPVVAQSPPEFDLETPDDASEAKASAKRGRGKPKSTK